MLSQETMNTIIIIGLGAGAIIAGIVGGLWKLFASWQRREHQHLEENVAKPITDGLTDVKELLIIQRQAFTDVIESKDQRYDDLKKQADDSIRDRDKLREEIEGIREKQRERDKVFSEFKSTFDGLEQALAKRDVDLTAARQTIADLNAKLTESGEVRKEVGELRSRINALEERVKTMIAREEQLVTENNDLKQQISHKDELIAQRDAKIAALEAKIALLEKAGSTELQKSAAADI